MSLQDLISLSGIPGLPSAATLVGNIYQTAENIKVYRGQCRDLSRRCASLMIALRESSVGMEDTEALRAADAVEAIVSRAHRKLGEWASLNLVRSFIQQSDIKRGIEDLYQEIDFCYKQFNITSNLELNRGQKDLAAIQARDQDELRVTLRTIIKNQDDLKTILGMQRPVVEHVMQSIQEELQDSGTSQESQVFRQGLWELHSRSNILPPMTDLTGQVMKTSDHPVALGGFNDVYMGIWLGEEKVALKLARHVNVTNNTKKRFHREVEIWRGLQHPNIARLYGIAYFGDYVYSVSPWMENGHSMMWIKSHPEADRLRLLNEVASGLEYLHLHKVVHGDLRGANVLISDTGKACISDFGLSKVIDELSSGFADSGDSGASPVRWLAPELIEPERFNLATSSVTTASDVWSYGMLCLEIITGEKPFHNRLRDANVINDVVNGKLPERPAMLLNIRTVDDEIWKLMSRCWQMKAASRPTMTELKVAMKRLHTERNSPAASSDSGFVLSDSPGRVSLSLPPPSTPSLSSSASRSSMSSEGDSSRPELTVAGRGGFPLVRTSPHVPPLSPVSITTSVPTSLKSSTPWKTAPTSPISPSDSPVVSTSRPSPLSRYPTSSSLGIFGIPEHSGIGVHTKPALIRQNSKISIDTCLSVESTGNLYSHIRSSSIGSLPILIHRAETMQAPAPGDGGQESSLAMPSSLPRSFGSTLHHHMNSISIDRPPSETGGSSSYGSPARVQLTLALADTSNIVHLSSQGTVSAGTLEGLVCRLSMESQEGFANDVRYRNIFLTTYRAFSSAEKIADILMRQFHDLEVDGTATMEYRVGLRFSIIAVMKQWLETQPAEPQDMDVLQTLRDFSLSITSPPTMRTSAQQLVEIIDDNIAGIQARQSPSPIASPLMRRPSIKSSDIQPTALAIALTIMESDCFEAIVAKDCVLHVKQNPGQNPISVASDVNNRILNWVKKSVLHSNTLANRGEVLKYFVYTAEECWKLRNFSSMSAIVAGLESTTVARLKLTYASLDKDKYATQCLKRMASILDPAHNHQAYRDALNESQKECLPLLAVHLRDLMATFRGAPDTVEIEGRQLINFTKYIKLGERIRHILSYQRRVHDFDSQREVGALSYLSTQLRGVRADKNTEDALETRSLELQASEKKTYDSRELELRAVGFTPRPKSRKGSTSGK